MGYYAESRECDIRIPRENIRPAEAAARGRLGLTEMEPLKDIFRNVGFDCLWENDGGLRVEGFACDYPQKWTTDVDTLLKAVARWAVPGSYVILEGEDWELWMDYLDDEGFHELHPKISLMDAFDASGVKSFHPLKVGGSV